MEQLKKQIKELQDTLAKYDATPAERALLINLKGHAAAMFTAISKTPRVTEGGETLAAILNPKFETKQPPRKDTPPTKQPSGALLATSDDVKPLAEQLEQAAKEQVIKPKKARRGRPAKK